jgi:uncharacterized membrane protein
MKTATAPAPAPIQESAREGVSRHVAHNIERIADLHARAEEGVGGHQRFVERLASFVGRPSFFYAFVIACAGWVGLNLGLRALGHHPYDPPPFQGMQGVVGLVALGMANVIIITQNRQGRKLEYRAHLDLQVSMLAEQKIAKLIALLEELRVDLPNVHNRRDDEAQAMTEPADPAAVVAAIKETLPDDEQ